MWLPRLSRKPKPAQCSLCWLKGLRCSVENKAKDPSSHICLVQHKSVWEEEKEEEKCICCSRKKKSLQCQGKTLCWWWKHWRVLLGLVKSNANELAERKKREWQRGIMKRSGLRRQPYIVQWGWERVVGGIKGSNTETEASLTHVLLLTILIYKRHKKINIDTSAIQKNETFILHVEWHPRVLQWVWNCAVHSYFGKPSQALINNVVPPGLHHIL